MATTHLCPDGEVQSLEDFVRIASGSNLGSKIFAQICPDRWKFAISALYFETRARVAFAWFILLLCSPRCSIVNDYSASESLSAPSMSVVRLFFLTFLLAATSAWTAKCNCCAASNIL